jgi:hypothetical protein
MNEPATQNGLVEEVVVGYFSIKNNVKETYFKGNGMNRGDKSGKFLRIKVNEASYCKLRSLCLTDQMVREGFFFLVLNQLSWAGIFR